MTLDRPPPPAGPNEALAFLRRARKLRGLTEAQLRRVERRLDQSPSRSPAKNWQPWLAALGAALIAGTAVASVANPARLPLIGGLFAPAEPARTIPPRRPTATPRPRPSLPEARPSDGSAASPAPSAGKLAGEATATTEGPRPAAASPPNGAQPPMPSPARRALPVASEVAADALDSSPPRTSPRRFVAKAPSAAPAREARSKALPDDPLAAESRSFSVALGAWHRDHDAIAALAALDEHERRFPRGQIQVEVRVLRAEILLKEGREREALTVLDEIPLAGLPRGRELQTVRGELRVKFLRCAEGRRDLGEVVTMDAADVLGVRAARAISLCP